MFKTYRDFYFAIKGKAVYSAKTNKPVNRTELFFKASDDELQAIVSGDSVMFYTKNVESYNPKALENEVEYEQSRNYL